MPASYEDYYKSGTYDRRYPRPNTNMLRLLLRMLDRNKFAHVVDFGSGNGRYLIPLLAASGLTATAVEPSTVARTQLTQRATESDLSHLIDVVPELSQTVLSTTEPVFAMALFGVLSHIVNPYERTRALSELRGLIEPDGRLVISVPNRWRRFYRQQLLNLRRGDTSSAAIKYERKLGELQGQFAYHLYTAKALRRELQEAGLSVVSTQCESLLPERTVTSSVLASWLDGRAARALPAPVGYGLVAICSPT